MGAPNARVVSLVEAVVRAPSAHNTQPWWITPQRSGELWLTWDPQRHLRHGDPTGRDLDLALGAAAEAARLRALAAGERLTVELEPLAAAPTEGERVARLVPRGPARATDDEKRLERHLTARKTVRRPHEPDPLETELVDRLRREAEAAELTLGVVSDRDRIDRLATLTQQATTAQFADDAVHRELYRWLRLDPRDPAYRRDGLTADCMELGPVTRRAAALALRPGVMRLLARASLHALVAADAAAVVRRSATICLVSAPDAARARRLRAGGTLLRLWTAAAAEQAWAHPLSALLDVSATRSSVTELFGATRAEPLAIFRLGRATRASAVAPRLPLAEILRSPV